MSAQMKAIVICVCIFIAMCVCMYLGYILGTQCGSYEQGKEDEKKHIRDILMRRTYFPLKAMKNGVCMAVWAVDDIAAEVGLEMHDAVIMRQGDVQ